MFLSNLVTLLKVAKKKLTLDAATEAFQFFSDCNETESVIKEFITLAKSKVILWIRVRIDLHNYTISQDFGQDKLTAVSLLGRHKDLQDKIQSIEPDVVRVGQVGEKLSSSNYSSEALYLAADPGRLEDTEKLVPVEMWEDEPFERTEIQRVIEERKVPQVRTLYPYKGHGMEVKKGEMMFLLDKTNQDWWNIR